MMGLDQNLWSETQTWEGIRVTSVSGWQFSICMMPLIYKSTYTVVDCNTIEATCPCALTFSWFYLM